MKKILIDTNIYSALLKGEKSLLEVFSKANLIYLSVFVIAELLSGFKGGKKESENYKILEKFIQKPSVVILDATFQTAEAFSFLKNELKKKGRPVPINDLWIASHAVETGSVLVSYDKHFEEIPGLMVLKL
ncbi:MAG: type II toxin-antitoxin system VapC family toxin [Spirochaetia bacterium]|nr:type II toxin-antitoxin system VapC family toxin [Spirochaetia bacterium]